MNVQGLHRMYVSMFQPVYVQCLSSSAVFRAGLVPRVCRRWHRITAHPSMWPTLDIKPQDSSMFAWLRQRSPGFRHLTLHVSAGCLQLPPGAWPRQYPGAASLRYICFDTMHTHRVVMPCSSDAPKST